MALYKWGKANFELGVEKVEYALKIYEEYKGKDLNRTKRT